jgi:hypothetical protein
MSEWKPGDILLYQWGGFSGDASEVIVLSADPWKCVGVDGDTSYVPDSPDRKLYPVKKLRGEWQRKAAATLHAHGLHDKAFDLMLVYANELEAESKQTLTGSQQSTRAQAEHINLCHAEIGSLRKEVERLKAKAGEK